MKRGGGFPREIRRRKFLLVLTKNIVCVRVQNFAKICESV